MYKTEGKLFFCSKKDDNIPGKTSFSEGPHTFIANETFGDLSYNFNL